MQENEFEKKIREKMDGLQLIPGEEVWKKVAANIQKEKRRKRFIFFLFAFTFLAGSTAFYFYDNLHKNSSALASGNDIARSGIQSNKTHTDLTTSKDDAHVSVLSNKPTDLSDNDQPERIQKKEELNVVIRRTGSYPKNIETRNVGQSIVNTDKQAPSEKTITSDAKDRTGQPSRPVEKAFNEHRDAIQDLANGEAEAVIEKALNKPIAAIKKDTSQPNILQGKSAKKIKIQSNKKWSIGFTVFSGVSDNLSGLNLFHGGAASYSNYNPSTTPGSGNANTINKLNYKSAFSYGFGLYLKKHLNRTISLSAGANYHFLSATSLAGSRNSSTQTFYDASFQSSAVVNSYYNSGQSVKYKNKYYLLQFPLNIIVQLNKDQDKPVSFTAGVSPAYLIRSKALYANMNQNVYYENNEQFRKLEVAGQTGLQFTVANARYFSIAAGPEVQYGLNNIAKPATGTDQHLFSAAVKINFILK